MSKVAAANDSKKLNLDIVQPEVNVIKLFLEEIWKIEISPLAKTARISHYKSNKQFLSIVLLKNSIVFTFLCRF